jgi:hypothetical protein
MGSIAVFIFMAILIKVSEKGLAVRTDAVCTISHISADGNYAGSEFHEVAQERSE